MTAPAFNPVPVDAADQDPMADLHAAIQNWRAEQDQVAARMLSQPDSTLDPLRARIRPALAPIMAAFDAQRATVERAASGPDRTITAVGREQQLAAIAANRREAVEALVAPAREALAAAHAQTRAQITAVADTATEADVEAATELAYRVMPLTAANQVPLLAKYLRAAATAGDVGRAAALLPYVRSLEETYPDLPAVTGLGTMLSAITATWQLTVANARLARIERMQWELHELTTAALQGGRDAELTLRLRGIELADGDGLTAGADGTPVAPRRESPSGKAKPRGFRRVRITPEQRETARAQQRALAGDE